MSETHPAPHTPPAELPRRAIDVFRQDPLMSQHIEPIIRQIRLRHPEAKTEEAIFALAKKFIEARAEGAWEMAQLIGKGEQWPHDKTLANAWQMMPHIAPSITPDVAPAATKSEGLVQEPVTGSPKTPETSTGPTRSDALPQSEEALPETAPTPPQNESGVDVPTNPTLADIAKGVRGKNPGTPAGTAPAEMNATIDAQQQRVRIPLTGTPPDQILEVAEAGDRARARSRGGIRSRLTQMLNGNGSTRKKETLSPTTELSPAEKQKIRDDAAQELAKITVGAAGLIQMREERAKLEKKLAEELAQREQARNGGEVPQVENIIPATSEAQERGWWGKKRDFINGVVRKSTEAISATYTAAANKYLELGTAMHIRKMNALENIATWHKNLSPEQRRILAYAGITSVGGVIATTILSRYTGNMTFFDGNESLSLQEIQELLKEVPTSLPENTPLESINPDIPQVAPEIRDDTLRYAITDELDRMSSGNNNLTIGADVQFPETEGVLIAEETPGHQATDFSKIALSPEDMARGEEGGDKIPPTYQIQDQDAFEKANRVAFNEPVAPETPSPTDPNNISGEAKDFEPTQRATIVPEEEPMVGKPATPESLIPDDTAGEAPKDFGGPAVEPAEAVTAGDKDAPTYHREDQEVLEKANRIPFNEPIVPEAPKLPQQIASLEKPFVVKSGDNAWNLLRDRLLAENPDFKGFSIEKQRHIIDSLIKHLEGLPRPKLSEIGFPTSRVSLVRPGNALDFRTAFTGLDVEKLFTK